MRTRLILLILGMSALALALARVEAADELPTQRRRPAALALAEDGRLFVANRASGTISILDTTTEPPMARAEVPVGKGLADLAITPDGRSVLAADAVAHRLIWLDRRPDGLTPRASRSLPAAPVAVRLANGGRLAVVASLWGRCVSGLEMDPTAPEPLRVLWQTSLPFNPRHLLPLDDPPRLIVADSFGGGLAALDLHDGRLVATHRIPAHNIGGLARATDGRLLLTQQFLNRHARTTPDDIHWGSLINNSVRSLRIEAVLSPEGDPSLSGQLHQLGSFGNGAGDPAGLAVLPGGDLVVALGGLGQVTSGPITRPDTWGRAVGRRPTAVVARSDGRRLFVANMLDDSITMIGLPEGSPCLTIALGPTPEDRPVDRGERLFFDARLSHEGWMSCHSCHTEGHANHLRADTLGDGSFGSPKRVPSLLGIAHTAPFAWDGSIAALEDQVRKSVKTTMRGPDLSPEQVTDLTAFLRALEPPPPPVETSDRPRGDAGRGRAVFARRCADCHAGPQFTSPGTKDVGLADERGARNFNPPSLRGVSQRDALFHDGRARGLDDALLQVGHPDLELDPIPQADLADLLAYLRRL